ncbi:hypothetical protein POM88_020625 [Heracleum sosnowskyi]|uniref:HMA domain-containing protein n=1 Tax=Heracleum sosnowskyi TaxID=360622 RepID=A0AAD8MNA2_9APIA|nr:hypothetical protein POM88_020625 [Heracleum sosnowskyi]
MLACFGFGKCQEKPLPPFTSFLIKVDLNVAWESTVAKILKKTKLEMSNLKMYGEGVFQISGALDPEKLLKVLKKTGKKASLVTIKSGGCSENLHMKEFEKRQGYKGKLKNYIEMQTLYNDFYQKYVGGFGYGYGYGYGQDNYDYYGNGYVGNPRYFHG